MARPVIHPLNCGTMCPRAAASIGIIDHDPGHLVAHCLLIETSGGLVLLDTGYGSGDVDDPKRLGASRHLLNAKLDHDETAVAQVRALGHDPADVRHILTTHLDLDHAGGLGDFPQAEVHTHRDELASARKRSIDTKLRYRPKHWAHNPRWVEHTADGEEWFGFERARLLEDIDVEILMLPLSGHSVGHSGYAINLGDGWLLHAGDAYIHHGEVASPPQTTRGRAFYHQINSSDSKLRRHNADRLSELAREHGDEVTLFCSHDAKEFQRIGEFLSPPVVA